jgi:hypothetical protein
MTKPMDDEASLSIAAGALGRRLSTFFAWILMRISGNKFVVTSAVVLMVPLIGLPLWPDNISSAIRSVVNNPLVSTVLAYLGMTLFAALFLGTLLLAIAAMCLAVYGRELFFSFLNAEICANSVREHGSSHVGSGIKFEPSLSS